MEKSRNKKLIAPIAVAIIIGLLITLYILLLVFVPIEAPVAKILFIAAQIGSICVLIHVLIQRIKEIKSGEEDDLDKY